MTDSKRKMAQRSLGKANTVEIKNGINPTLSSAHIHKLVSGDTSNHIRVSKAA